MARKDKIIPQGIQPKDRVCRTCSHGWKKNTGVKMVCKNPKKTYFLANIGYVSPYMGERDTCTLWKVNPYLEDNNE